MNSDQIEEDFFSENLLTSDFFEYQKENYDNISVHTNSRSSLHVHEENEIHNSNSSMNQNILKNKQNKSIRNIFYKNDNIKDTQDFEFKKEGRFCSNTPQSLQTNRIKFEDKIKKSYYKGNQGDSSIKFIETYGHKRLYTTNFKEKQTYSPIKSIDTYDRKEFCTDNLKETQINSFMKSFDAYCREGTCKANFKEIQIDSFMKSIDVYDRERTSESQFGQKQENFDVKLINTFNKERICEAKFKQKQLDSSIKFLNTYDQERTSEPTCKPHHEDSSIKFFETYEQDSTCEFNSKQRKLDVSIKNFDISDHEKNTNIKYNQNSILKDTNYKKVESYHSRILGLKPSHWSKKVYSSQTTSYSLPKYVHLDRIQTQKALFTENNGVVHTLKHIGPGKSDSIMRIDADTLQQLILEKNKSFEIIDCRFQYEYDGGHIRDAININTVKTIEKFYHDNKETIKLKILVFHCEYSSVRAPRLAHHLRNMDRKKNEYPNLLFPEIYILEGGYKFFFARFKELCTPKNYISMDLNSEEDNEKVSSKKRKKYNQ